jgi:precorrin-8X/cobalt-precorrin-8 methylmutase
VVIHPIEQESYEILRERVDLSNLDPVERAVVERMIHATADLDYAGSTVISPGAAAAGVAALRAGAPVICDVQMVRHGITSVAVTCLLEEVSAAADGDTRSAAAMRLAAARHADGAIIVIGCAPTALFEVIALVEQGALRPALVIGLPVGFVGAAESKAMLRASGLPAISNIGEKGGSAVAAAALNALARLSRSTS